MTTYAPTFQNVQSIVFDKLRLDATDDLTRVKNAINNASNRVASDTKYLSTSVTGSALTAAASSASLDSSMIELDYITCTYGGQTLVLGQLTYDRILRYRQQPNVAGPPIAYVLRKDTIEFWPSAVGGEVIVYYGAGLPTLLSGNTDVLPYPEPYGSNLLAYGAAQELSEFTKDILLAQTFQGKYNEWMALFVKFINRRRGQLPTHMIVDDGSHSFLPHDPSSDWDLVGPRPFGS